MDYLSTHCALSDTKDDFASELRKNESNDNFNDEEVDEYEMNIEDFIDHMDADNLNRKTLLYSDSPISIYDASVRLVRLTQSLNLDKTKTSTLLQEIRYFFLSDCRLPKTVFRLLKITNNDNIPEAFITFI